MARAPTWCETVCRAQASGRELVPGVQWSAAWEGGRSSAQTVTEPFMVGPRLLARVWNKARAQGAFVEGWVSSRAHQLSQRQLRAVMGGTGCRRRQRGARPAAGSGGGPADTGTSGLGGFAWQVRGEVWAVGEERGGAGDPVCHLLALATPFVLANRVPVSLRAAVGSAALPLPRPSSLLRAPCVQEPRVTVLGPLRKPSLSTTIEEKGGAETESAAAAILPSPPGLSLSVMSGAKQPF